MHSVDTLVAGMGYIHVRNAVTYLKVSPLIAIVCCNSVSDGWQVNNTDIDCLVEVSSEGLLSKPAQCIQSHQCIL